MNQPILQPIAVKRQRFREAAYQAIKEAILAGQLESEQPLVEEQLAERLHISRTPVREALALLEHEQLISPRGGRGLYVRKLSREEFVQIFVANETVEPYLVRRAALLATDDQLVAIGETVARGESCAVSGDLPGFLRSARDFHRCIGEASANIPLTQFVVANEERTDMVLLAYGRVVDPANMAASNREHAAIFEALKQRDPEAAVRLTVYHAQSLRERFAELFTVQSEE